jgi:hypothetical protein
VQASGITKNAGVTSPKSREPSEVKKGEVEKGYIRIN